VYRLPAGEAPRVTPRATSFAPRIGLTVLTLLAVALFVRAGFWQWGKGLARQAAWASFAKGADTLRALGSSELDAQPLYQRVSVTGQLDAAHQFLLDNRSWQGRPGYEVLTPLTRAGATTLLVDRGWVPFTGSRARLPDVSLSAPPAVTLTGRVGSLPSPGLASGRAPPSGAWPKVTSYPDAHDLAAALAVPVSERVLLLDAGAPFGYVRDWQAPGLSPLRHFSYAIQWWSFAVLAIVLWAVTARRPKALR
jgi:surfeit locus 1 family protein